MKPDRHRAQHRRRQDGISIVELMVAIVVGMIGILIMFQVFQVWQERKETTASGSDAQTAGSIAMFTFARDVRAAGYGFGSSTHSGCSVDSAYTGAGGLAAFPLYPVLISHGAGGTDTLTTIYGNSDIFTSSRAFADTLIYPATDTHIVTDTTKGGNTGITVGDWLLLAQTKDATDPTQDICKLVQATAVGADASIDHSTKPAMPAWLPTTPTPPEGDIFSLGRIPQRNTWQINIDPTSKRSSLVWTDTLNDAPGTLREVSEGIVALRAQYGIDTFDSGDNTVGKAGSVADGIIGNNEWTDSLPPAANWTPNLDWSKVLAIRLALLARSQQYEKDPVTTTAPSWTGGSFTMRNVDGTADSSPGDTNDWRHYRYRVYESVVSLRNTLWGTAP